MPPPSALLLVDGSIPGLVALAHAREHAAFAQAAAPLAMLCPLTTLTMPQNERTLREVAAREQCQRHSIGFIESSVAAQASQLALTERQKQAAALLHAAHLALQHQAPRVIWCVHAAQEQSIDLDTLAWSIDLALVVARLATLTADNAQGVAIETPYIDVSDAQLADLAHELGAPISTCWWWRGPHTCDEPTLKKLAATQQARWLRALTSVGWFAASEQTAST